MQHSSQLLTTTLSDLANAAAVGTVPAMTYGRLIALAESASGKTRESYLSAAGALWLAKVEDANGNHLGARAQLAQAFLLTADAAFTFQAVAS